MATIDNQQKRIAYYVVALVALFFLCWSAADILSAGANLFLLRTSAISMPRTGPDTTGEPLAPDGNYPDIYRQMVIDRVVDSGARLLVAGGVFLMTKRRLRELKA